MSKFRPSWASGGEILFDWLGPFGPIASDKPATTTLAESLRA
jgi:hypothetical protein